MRCGLEIAHGLDEPVKTARLNMDANMLMQAHMMRQGELWRDALYRSRLAPAASRHRLAVEQGNEAVTRHQRRNDRGH
jgi:hypothetical protein